MANPSMKKMMLYFNNYNKVMMIDSTGKQVKEVGNTSAASGLDYHLGNKKLFYTDTEKRKVFVMSLTSNNGGQLLDYSLPGAWSPVSLAVDWIGNNIYVVDSLGQKN
jgi:low density lipoprotein-related protein 2